MIAFKGDYEEFERRIIERGKSSGRLDDSSGDVAKRRMYEYAVQTEPTLLSYSNELFAVDAMLPIDEVTELIESELARR